MKKLFALLLAALMAFALMGCATTAGPESTNAPIADSTPAPTEAPEPKPEATTVPEDPVAEGLQDGKYLVDVIGHEGKLTVCTTFFDGAIADVQVLTNHETQGVGTYAVERIPPAIVEHQSTNVDSVSGATITSSVIKYAVVQAITEAGGNPDDFSAPVEAPAPVEQTVEEDVSVAIMGAGTAGIFAAARLLEMGVTDVILFEELDIPGGCMPLTYGGIVSTGSKINNAWGLGADYYKSWENLSAFMDPEGKGTPYTQQMFEKAGELIDWMANIGIGFCTMGSRPGYAYAYFAPGCYDGGVGYAMEFLVKRIESKGGRIIYATSVTDLIQDESGAIVGLIAEGEDGTTWRVTADAVLLASGSFANNPELVEQYQSDWAGSFFNTIKSANGDGLLLGIKYGAGIDGMNGHIPGFLASYKSHFELAFMHLSTPGIIVNVNGDQFGNIMTNNHSVMAAAKADPANGDTFYFIFDEAAAIQTQDYQNYGFDSYKAIFENGEAVHYDSLEQAAQELNLPNLTATVETNNQLALTGGTDEWGRSNLPYIDTREGVWAIRVDPNAYLTTGGLMIDLATHVLTQEGEIIPGLYAAGDVVGSIEQKDGRTYGYGFDAAMTYGAIAAETMIADGVQ